MLDRDKKKMFGSGSGTGLAFSRDRTHLHLLDMLFFGFLIHSTVPLHAFKKYIKSSF